MNSKIRSKIPIQKYIDTGNDSTFKIPILTIYVPILLHNSSQNSDLKCNRIHYQYLYLV